MSDSESTAPSVPMKPKHFWRTLILQYLLTLFVVGGLEAVCLMDWRSLFWAALLLAVLRLHVDFWGWLLPKRLQPLGIVVGIPLILTPLLVLHHIIWAYWLNPVKISKATTFITEPLTPDGKRVDFFAALEQRMTPNLPPEENGFRLLVQALGPQVLGYKNEPLDKWKQRRWNQLCGKMHWNPEDIEPNVTIHTSLQEWLREIDTARNPEPENRDERIEWQKRQDVRLAPEWKRSRNDLLRLDENPDIVRWIEHNNEIFDIFGKAVREPVFFTPFFQDENYPSLYFMDQISMPTTLSFMLRHRIRYHLENGELDRAWYDIMTCFYFTEHELKNAFNSQMFFLPMSMQPYKEVVGILRRDDLSPEKLNRYRKEIEPFLDPLDEKTLENLKFGDRLFCLDLILRHTYDRGWTGPVRLPCLLAWNQAVIGFNRRFDKTWIPPDRIFSLENKHDWQRREDNCFEVTKFVGWFVCVKGVSKAIPCMLAEFALATHGNVCGCGYPHDPFDNRGTFARRRLLDLAFALEEYRLTNGSYPEELNLLERTDTTLELIDPFTDDHPFRYERFSTGYRLYSIGYNGKDDSGVEDYENKKDDITVQMP